MTTSASDVEIPTAHGVVTPKRAAGVLLLCGVGLILLLWAIGWPLVNTAAFAWVRRLDAESAVGLLADRTPTWNDLTHLGSSMADTFVCIGVLIASMLLLRWWLGRWHESIVLLVAIAGELILFLAVTGVIARDRPMVPLLDAAPPTSSYPSGHTAAAVALYGCLSVILARNLRPRWVAAVAVGLLWCVPAVVGMSRLYRGMHHVSDVVIGAAAGGAWLIAVVVVLYPASRYPGGRTRT